MVPLAASRDAQLASNQVSLIMLRLSHDTDRSNLRVVTTAVLIGIAGLVTSLSFSRAAEPSPTKIDFKSNGIGVPPADFEFWRTGQGSVGQWAVVRDQSAVGSAAVEQYSSDPAKNRFPLAIYKPASAKNLEVSVQFKLVSGPMQSAGIAFRLTSASNYYVVRASARDERVALLRVTDGTIEEISGVDAEVAQNHWQTLAIVAKDDQFAISLDGEWILTVFDRTFVKPGHVALWTEGDNVTRFDEIDIKPLPQTEWER
jgi:hypothetical protein